MSKKYTIEVDAETHAKLHAACPGLIAEPPAQKDVWDWEHPFWPNLLKTDTVRGYGIVLVVDTTSGHIYLDNWDIAQLRDHLTEVLARSGGNDGGKK